MENVGTKYLFHNFILLQKAVESHSLSFLVFYSDSGLYPLFVRMFHSAHLCHVVRPFQPCFWGISAGQYHFHSLGKRL